MTWVPWVCWAAILQALAYSLLRDWLLNPVDAYRVLLEFQFVRAVEIPS